LEKSIYDRRLVLFSGKGGVGKTTAASAFALSCALKGQRTLLIELNVKDRLSSLFGAVEVGEEITEIEHNLWAVNTTPKAALREYAIMILRVKFVYKAVFENPVIASFLRVIPGLNELVMLGKAWYHTVEEDDRGRFVWDKVVVDAPATGHGIFFLKIPSVITSIIKAGPMYKEARKIEALLQDPDITALCLVTLPEEMPVNETLMFRKIVYNELKVPIGAIIANCVYPTGIEHEDMPWVLEANESVEGSSVAESMLQAAAFRAKRVNMQSEYLKVLDELTDEPMVRIPYYFTERFNFQTIRKIADNLLDQLPGADKGDA
jgi:anion-transporting  ArsA/GET3 family ATPase